MSKGRFYRFSPGAVPAVLRPLIYRQGDVVVFDDGFLRTEIDYDGFLLQEDGDRILLRRVFTQVPTEGSIFRESGFPLYRESTVPYEREDAPIYIVFGNALVRFGNAYVKSNDIAPP